MAGKGKSKLNTRRVWNPDTSIEFNYYFNLLKNMNLAKYTWHNLPDSVDSRYLELCLFNSGESLFFYDDILDQYLSLRNMEFGYPNVYGIPTLRRGVGENQYNFERDITNSVIIYNNLNHMPTLPIVNYHATKMAMLSVIKDLNLQTQRTPFIITCTDEQRLTFLNLWKQYASSEPIILGTKGLDLNEFKVIPTMSPFVADKIADEMEMEINRAMTAIGVGNVPVFKKERVNTSETQLNIEKTLIIRKSELDARNKACDKIMKMFGLKNLFVTYEYYAQEYNIIEGGGNIGNIHTSYQDDSGESEQQRISSRIESNSSND